MVVWVCTRKLAVLRVLPYRWLVSHKLHFQNGSSKFAEHECLGGQCPQMSQVLKSICPLRIPCRQSKCAPTQTYNGFSSERGCWHDERHSF